MRSFGPASFKVSDPALRFAKTLTPVPEIGDAAPMLRGAWRGLDPERLEAFLSGEAADLSVPSLTGPKALVCLEPDVPYCYPAEGRNEGNVTGESLTPHVAMAGQTGAGRRNPALDLANAAFRLLYGELQLLSSAPTVSPIKLCTIDLTDDLTENPIGPCDVESV